MRTGESFTYINAPSTIHDQSPYPPPHVDDTWQSPVPYLFGGIAAMLGLIALSLLILACSYWCMQQQSEEGGDSTFGHQNGDGSKQKDCNVEPVPCFVEGFVVIMAGDQKPTFLATPVSSKGCDSFGGDGGGDRTAGEGGPGNGAADDRNRQHAVNLQYIL